MKMEVKILKKMSNRLNYARSAVLLLVFFCTIFITSSLSSYAAGASVFVGSAVSTNSDGYYEIPITLSGVSLTAGKSIEIELSYNNIAFSIAKTTFSSSVKSYASASGTNPYHIKITAGSSALKPSGVVCTVYLEPTGILEVKDYHINVSKVSGVSASTSQGTISVTCSHTYEAYSTVESTCTVGGYTIERCSICKEYRRTGQRTPLGHDYKEIDTVEPDCVQHGYTVEECSRCKLRNIIEGEPPLGHEYGQGDCTVIDPTCAMQGYTEYRCLRDGCDATKRIDYTEKTDHIGGDTVIIESTCQKHGSENTYCIHCGILVDEKTLELVPHEFKDTVIEPTCTTPGYTYRKCLACNTVRRENQIAMLPHSYTSVLEKAADCVSSGRIKYICSCGNGYTEEIPCLGHSYIKESIIDATEESEGMITYVCTVCGDTRPQIVPIGSVKPDDQNGNLLDVKSSDTRDRLSGRETLLLYIILIIICFTILVAVAIIIKRMTKKLILSKKHRIKNV